MLRSFLLFAFLVGAVQANDIDLHLASLDGGLRDKIKKIREEKGASSWIKKETLLQSSLQVGDQKRTYSYYKPKQITNETGVIFVFHGGEGSGQKAADQTGFNNVGAKHNMFIVYPDSLDKWGDGRKETEKFAQNDLEFVRLLTAEFRAKINDEKKIYATGVSNGGNFTLRLACELGNEFAAFAPVIASFPVDYMSKCHPSHPTRIMMINGTEDGLIKWNGGSIKNSGKMGAGGEVVSVPQMHNFWLNFNQCSSHKLFSYPNLNNQDGSMVDRLDYNCYKGTEVSLVKIIGGGHTFPGGNSQGGFVAEKIVGKVNRDINAADEIYNFFTK